MTENIGDGVPSDAAAWGVVVVNWNTPGDTIECLGSLLAAGSHPRRVVVVDNASTDDSVATLEAWARGRGRGVLVASEGEEIRDDVGDAWLLIIAGRRTRGFSANNNLGLRYFRDRTDASHVLLLNNDASVAPDFFEKLSVVVGSWPKGGLITGTIFHDPDRARIWYAGGEINPLRALVTHRTAAPPPGPVETPFVCGCAMLIARPVMAAAGLLPECYDPIYCEDADYSLRARAAGFQLIYAPQAHVYHKVGATVGEPRRSPTVTFSANRNRALLVRRNFTGWRRAAGLAYLLVTKPGRALLEAAQGRPNIGWALLRGMLAGVFRGNVHGATR